MPGRSVFKKLWGRAEEESRAASQYPWHIPTRTTTPPSGPSTAESKPPAEPSPGSVEDAIEKASSLLADDPYWFICLTLWRLLSRKRGYYGCREDPLSNAMGVSDDGINPWKYQVARIGEKCRRLRGPLGTIAIRETLMDMAGHAVVAVACLNRMDPPKEGTDR